MNYLRTLAVSTFVLGFAAVSFGGVAKDSTKTAAAPKQLKPQTNCPVMGDEIDSSAYTDIQGQRVYFCCKMCDKKLRADPEKYFKKAAEQGVLFENVQKLCPVTGKAIDKRFFVDHVGRRVFFSDDTCAAQFAKDPATYLKKLDE
jgi:YHS domain-containing protein